jgi:hypothetical protein
MQKRTLHLLVPVIVGIFVGIVFLYNYLPSSTTELKFEELALGKETSSLYASIDGTQIHCKDLSDAYDCINGYKNIGKNMDVVLWLGNSQLHAINQMHMGDETSTSILHRYLRSNGKYLITFSQPNANLQEHYLLFEYLIRRLPISSLILSVVFDDMRETGIRSSLSDIFKDSSITKHLENTAIGKILLANKGNKDSAGNDLTALGGTVQEKAEKLLNDQFSSLWKIWEERAKLRGSIFKSLYLFRNWVFGINPSSTRKMIPGRYILNKNALEALLKSAQLHNINVLLYIVPLRDDIKVPYNLKEYNKFKKEIQSIAFKYGANFKNLEHLVPAEYWGSKGSTTIGSNEELDFMHFQAKGHQLLAEELYSELRTIYVARKK